MAKSFKTMNKKRATEVIQSAESIIASGRQKLIEQGLLNGTITRENFLSVKEEIILPINVVNNPLVLLALNYDCNSKVGIWTNKAMNICTALPSEFINDTGLGANDKFKKAFLCVTTVGKKQNYTRIFKDNLNIHTFSVFKGEDYKVDVYYVSDKEIDAFAEEIASLDLTALTVEDIKAIQADLWFLFRAWQESAIDMTKDKDKQFGIAMDEVLGNAKVRTSVKFQDIKTNNYKIKEDKYDKRVKVEDIPSLIIDLAEYDKNNQDFLETTLSEAQAVIRERIEQELQFFANTYVNDANVSELEQYVRYAKEYPKLAMTIMDIYRVIKDYNNVSKEEKAQGKKLTNKDYALLRAIAYNDAKELDIAPEYVCAIGIGVAASSGVYVSDTTGDIIVKEFDAKVASKHLYCAERLFGNIMVLEKGIMYGSDMVVDELYIKQEVDPKHIFTDVSNGRYKVKNGDATDVNGNLIFDLRQQELTGEVVVEDAGIYFLYDPLTEVDNAPNIDAVFISETEEEEGFTDDDVARHFESVLKGQQSYTITGDTIIIKDEAVAYVDEDYAVSSDIEEVRTLTRWYGVSGIRWSEERPINRNNQFLLLDYDIKEIESYINSITEFIG